MLGGLIVSLYMRLPRVCPGQSPFPLIPLLPHLLLYLLVSLTFPLFPFLLVSFIFLLYHPFPLYQNTPTPVSRPDEATKAGFSFFSVDFVINFFS